MGRDLDLQYSGVIPAGGIRVDMGAIDFSSGSSTVDFPTVLTKCRMGMAIAQTKDAGNQTIVATTDGDITAGKITFTRNGVYITEDARYYVLIFGI